MKITTYDELKTYLATFTNVNGESAPYDFVGAFQLLGAILSSVSKHHLDSDLDSLEETGFMLRDSEKRMLEKLLIRFGSKQ